MKKLLIGIIVLIVIVAGGGYAWYHNAYGGDSYYVKITADGQKLTDHDSSGKAFDYYSYDLKGADEKGNTKEMEFTASHNLRKEAYLKLTDNAKKGVTNWEEVQPNQVPQKALSQID